MIIRSLILFGYKRLRLNNRKKIIITPTNAIQLILGTNGCGKSSLLEELSPLPANPNNYSRDGYKIIEIDKNNIHYILKSQFEGSQPRHSFKQGDEELNPGGTITVQKELVKQIFGITPEIHDLAIGVERFTQMSPARRRDWFTRLGECNYNYAIGVYNKIKETYRDTTGALKIAKNRLVTETEKLAKPEEIAELERVIAVIQNDLTTLMSNKGLYTVTKSEVEVTIDELLKKLDGINKVVAHSIKRCKVWLHQNKITELDQLVKLQQKKIAQQAILSQQIKEAVDKYSSIETQLNSLQDKSHTGFDELKDKIVACERAQTEYQNRKILKLSFYGEDVRNLHNAISSVENSINSIISEIHPNADNLYSTESLVDYKNKLLNERDSYNRLDTERAALHAQLQHLMSQKNGERIHCPKCTHEWIPGYSEETYQIYQKKFDDKVVELERQQFIITVLESKISKIIDYLNLIKQFDNITNNWPILNSFWEYIKENSILIYAPKTIIQLFSTLKNDLVIESHIHDLKTEQDNLNNVHETLIRENVKSIEDLQALVEQQQNEIGNMTNTQSRLTDEIAECQDMIVTIRELDKYHSEIEDLITNANDKTLLISKIQKSNVIDFCIRREQSILAHKENKLVSFKLQAGIVEDLNNQVLKLTSDEAVIKITLRTLSPTEGLIAEGLFGFIRCFVKQMNSIIEKIWSYPLKVIPCGLSDTGSVELDYKFPMYVQNELNIVPDVNCGSTGMKEIVDLAFRIITLRYLGLGDSPLYLDEFASSLDVAHKRASVELIKLLMEQMSFSQLYLVSHDYTQYSALSNTEVCVLSSENIMLPEEYNQHVVLE